MAEVTMAAVLSAYRDGAPKDNATLYRSLVDQGALSQEQLDQRAPVGAAGACHSLVKRAVRWRQQTLRRMGLLQRVDRGTWQIRPDAKGLEAAPEGMRVAVFGTQLGFAVWSMAESFFTDLGGEQIDACITSPPYPLARPRDYGNPRAQEYVDWFCRQIEPVVRNLRRGGNIAVNLGADVFEPHSPARSLYKERLVIALAERFALSQMDAIIWVNPCKPPGPTQWASKRRMQLGTGYEPIYVFCNDPLRSIADNRRCLLPHTPQHQQLLAAGGEARTRVFSNGAYRVRPGSFGNPTEGRIPRNVVTIRHNDPDQAACRAEARRLGVPAHAGLMPLGLAEMLVRFLSEEGGLVVDLFGGYATTGRAAEICNRRWIVVEKILQYLLCGKERFRESAGYFETGLASPIPRSI